MRLDELKGPRTLYVSRKVKNTQDIVEWAKQQGMESMLAPEELHVTICYSKEPMEWDDVKRVKGDLTVPAPDDVKGEKPIRKIEMFGKDHDILVLRIDDPELQKRNQEFRDAGASSDFPDYKPHITITYRAADLEEGAHEKIEPYKGEIVFGPEVFKEIEENWSDDAEEVDLTESVIMEAKVVDNGRESGTKVWSDVTPRQLVALSSQSDLRGIVTRDATYVWYAGDDVHYNVERRLGINPQVFFYVMGSDDSGMHDGGREEWIYYDNGPRRKADFKVSDHCEVFCSNYSKATHSDSFMAMIGQHVLMESRDDPEELPGRFWLNAETDKFLDCDDQTHAEYAEKHHRKMKLPAHEITEIVDDADALHEFEDLAMEHDWVMGDGRTLTASKVENLNRAAAYFVHRWPGEKLTLVLDGRWRTTVDAEDAETFSNDLLPDVDLDESAHAAPTPRKFWLVFDLPHSNRAYDRQRADEHVKTLQGISQGHLVGVRGISASREIITGFLAVARNAALVMDGSEVMRINDLERIAYEDPHYLVANNMSALYRIWQKSQDGWGHQGMMQNLMEYVIRCLKALDLRLYNDLKYYGFQTKVGDVWKEHAEAGQTISTLDQLRDFIIAAIHEAAGKKGRWTDHLSDMFEDMKPEIIDQAIEKALSTVAHVYNDEGEWIVRSPQFRIPEGSTLLIVVHKEDLNRFDEWKRNGEPEQFGFLQDRMETLDQLLNTIHEYDLEKRYRIRFVDAHQFNTVRASVLDRRQKKRSGQN